MSNYSFTLNEKQISQMLDYFNNQYFTNEKNNYIRYIFKPNDAVITVYTSNKVVITGKNADMYNEMFNLPTTVQITLPQAGSDEVGTGDFFGPVCVCATYLDEEIYEKIQQLKLDDSKKLTDEYMLLVAPKLMEIVPHSLLILTNEKYNQVITDNNMNKIKAKMHNQAYLNLIKKGIKLPKLIVIDDFCGETLYYKYLSGVNSIKGITFETKAESKYTSVAIGSMISRYAFLKEMEAMSKQYDMEFPKGAGSAVDSFGKKFVERYGKDELSKVAKLNFKNSSKILD